MAVNGKKMSFAYLVKQDCKDEERCMGTSLADPTTTEMNSNDVFEQSVKVVNLQIKNKQICTYDDGFTTNVNADMSYVPAYPSLSAKTEMTTDSLSKKGFNSEYVTVQLMGKSKNLDEEIKSTNTFSDPYYDYDNLRNQYEHGRVYEDYLSASDTNITCTVNGTIKYDSEHQAYLEWVGGKDTFDFTKGDIGNYEILIQNMETGGKFPYCLGHVRDFLKNTELTGYDGTNTTEQVVASDYLGKYTITGMNPYKRTAYKSNHINGVGKIELQIVPETGNFSMKFHLDLSKPAEYTHVNAGTIQIIVYNPNDARFLEKFHMLDTYGLMYAYDVDRDTAHRYVADTNGWHIYTNRPDQDIDEIKMKLKSYYIDKFKFKHFLQDVKITDYSSLDDVWIFSADRNLQFLDDENMYFDVDDDRYYYPTINRKYPKTVSEYFFKNSKIYTNDGLLINNVYDNDNVFILSVMDPVETANNIGIVTMETEAPGTEFVRVYEDYLASSDVGGVPVNNYEKFDGGDTENYEFISSYIHSFETGTVSSIISAEDEKTAVNNCQVKCQETHQDLYYGEYANVLLSSSNAEISDFTNIFVSYKKTQNLDIELYFNYFNFLDSRFVEIRDDGREYFKVVDNTYLKLGKDEDGILDICIQIKKFGVTGELIGVRTVKLASYHIYNISDDKPKFLIDEVYKIKPYDNYDEKSGVLNVQVANTYLDAVNADVTEGNKIKFDVVLYVKTLLEDCLENVVLQIPHQMFGVIATETKNYGITYSDEMVNIEVYGDVSKISIPCITNNTKEELQSYIGYTFPITINSIKTKSKATVNSQDGFVYIIGQQTQTVLSRADNGDYIGILNNDTASSNEIYEVT